jgi:hypothetical protein
VGVGGFNVGAMIPISQWLQFGVGYKVDFDPSNGVIPFRGFDVMGRGYFLGLGGRNRLVSSVGNLTRRSPWAAYVLGELSQRHYNFQSINEVLLEGDVGSVNLGLGVDRRLSASYALNLEVSYGVLSFSSDPANVDLLLMSFGAGLSYQF